MNGWMWRLEKREEVRREWVLGGMESERTVGPLVRRGPRSNGLWRKRMGSVCSRLTSRRLRDLPVETVAPRSLRSGVSRFVLGRQIV